MCSCIECIGDQPEPSVLEMELIEEKNNLESLLRTLLTNFFVNSDGELEWSYQPGYSISKINSWEFENKLAAYLSKEKQQEYADPNR